jgi:hypothetical protein
MKTVIFCWQQVCSNMPPTARDNFWGLGDIIRGVLATRQFCNAHGYEFLLDIHKHPFSAFLMHDISESVASLTDHTDVQFFRSLETVHTLPSPVVLMTNAWCKDPSEDDKQFIRDFLKVRPEHSIHIDPSPYNVLHFRLGDRSMDNDNSQYDALLLAVSRSFSPGDILCSDSTRFKQFLNTHFSDIRTYGDDVLAGHIGRERDPARLKTTLIDLQILMNARHIHTFSVYSWTSGFVDWVAKCYNIHVTPIKL